MSSLAAYDAFKTRLADWTDTPVCFENERWTSADTPAAFVYVEVFGEAYGQETMGAPGNNLFRETGMTYLHVMVPDDTGTRIARQHADGLMQLFREKDTDGVKIDDVSIGSGDPGRDFPNYWALTVTLWWHRLDFTQA